jgi:hypothetical protein
VNLLRANVSPSHTWRDASPGPLRELRGIQRLAKLGLTGFGILTGAIHCPGAIDDPSLSNESFSNRNATVATDRRRLPEFKSVSQYGITWTFTKPSPVGRYVNGDYYVVGPVTITNIDPQPLVGREVPESELAAGEKAFQERPIYPQRIHAESAGPAGGGL